MGSWRVPAAPQQCTIEVRKSRFIARAARAGSREAALAEVERARQDFPDASHHCWAYLVGDPATASSAAASDDGEPSGTAGRPILSVIRHKGVGDVVVVVTRWFGGVKLGAGGLVRAYAGAAEAVLSALELTRHRPMIEVQVEADFAHEQLLRHWAATHGAEVLDVQYRNAVHMRLRCPARSEQALGSLCAARGIGVSTAGTG